jgi:N-acetylneuraminate synthase
LNLNVLESFRDEWNIPIGLSDHSLDYAVAPLISVGKGVNVIEKHFTLSKKLPGPDHIYALEPDELSKMVTNIRLGELTLGDKVKRPHSVESELRDYRRGIFATKSIERGEIFTNLNTSILRRSGLKETDLKPKDIDTIIGKSASRYLEQYSLLSIADCDYES